MSFGGINLDALFLMAENRFNNSKDFYEEHKERIKAGVTLPMREIAAQAGEKLLAVDPLMNTVPWKMVSRIRRDTRFTNDKSLYRENMWIMFMRDKHQWPNYPCMWFEITPSDYSMGIGIFRNEPGFMRLYRKGIIEKKDEFIRAVEQCEKTGASLFGQEYKKTLPDCPAGLEKYYNRKDFGFIIHSDRLSDLTDDTIMKIIDKNFAAFSPMYKFLLDIADEYFSKEENN